MEIHYSVQDNQVVEVYLEEHPVVVDLHPLGKMLQYQHLHLVEVELKIQLQLVQEAWVQDCLVRSHLQVLGQPQEDLVVFLAKLILKELDHQQLDLI